MSVRKINTVFLDMDGVLSNFEKRWVDIFGESPLDTRGRKIFSPKWNMFCEGGEFENLELFPGALELVEYLQDKNLEISILSSSGGRAHHDRVAEQKTRWLKKHSLSFSEINIVPGRYIKKDFARADALIIDDTQDVIDSFIEAGGNAILHRDFKSTLSELNALYAI